MRVKVIFSIVLAFVSSVAWATPNIQTWTTSNGARVYFVSAPELAMADVRVVFDAGSARDGDKPGLALMTNGMLAEGAGKWNSDQIADRFEGVGAQFGNSAQRDMSVFSVRTLIEPEWFDTAVETFQTVLSKPTFPNDAFERERKRLLIALEQKKQDPGEISDDALYSNLYGKHPYAVSPDGTEVSVKKLKIDDLKAFYKKYMVAKNSLVAIVGKLDRKAAETLANRITAALPSGEAAAKIPAVTDLAAAKTITIDFPSTQSHVVVAQPGIARNHPDYFPLFVGNHILGGNGLVSILSDEIREKRGLSYSTYSAFIPMRERGPFLLGLQTRNDQAKDALNLLQSTLKDFVTNGPTQAQLDAAKMNLTGGFPMRIDANSKIVEYLSAIGFYGLPLDYLDKFIANIEAVTLDRVKDAFARNVQPDRMLVVVVGKQNNAVAK